MRIAFYVLLLLLLVSTPSRTQNIALIGSVQLRGGVSLVDIPSLPSGLIHYWKLNEASGVRSDSIGAVHLAETAPTSSAAGKNANAARFVWNASNFGALDGSGTIAIPSECSLSIWFKFDAVDSNQSFFVSGYTLGGGLFGVEIRCATDEIVFYHGTGAQYILHSFTPDTSWHHICVTAAGTTATIYLDGVGVASNVAATFDFSDWFAFTCSASNSGSTSGSVGLVDEVGVFNRALTQQEAINLWYGSAGVFLP